MTLAAGARLGPYEILSALGAGGMGEVYRARDCTPLQREVALKILPEQFALDPDRLARFRREAQVLASLNHQNIAAIYGFEESTPSAGSGRASVRALVLELVEGPTLADRIAQGPIPLNEALPIAKQIAEALEAAHEHGIIHRDLKPANVKVRPDGTVKVLDFGLAKLHEPNGPNATNDPNALSMSPTITSPALMTGAGVVLGTAAYMSPEQARGKPVDKRADIWAFGCVLYEMLTGRVPFAGETVSDTIGKILEREPDWSALPAATSASVRRLLLRCLAKDSRQRLRDVGDAKLEIDAIEHVLPGAAGVTAAAPRRWRSAMGVAVVVLSLSIAVVSWMTRRPMPSSVALEPMRFLIDPSESAGLVAFLNLSVSPDGRRLVYSASGADGITRLWIRSLETVDARPLVGTETVRNFLPFWSPDSRFVVFAADGKLKKIDASGGPPQTICDAPAQGAGGGGGGFWSGDDRIVFGGAGGLLQVAAGGGAPSQLTVVDRSRLERLHSLPILLPDGVHFLYLVVGPSEIGGIHVGSLDAKPEDQGFTRVLADQGNTVYVPVAPDATETGHLLFRRDGTLMAQPFDANRMELTAGPFVIDEQIATSVSGTVPVANFSASGNGVLVYRTGGLDRNQLTWFDRQGKVLGTAGQPGPHNMLTLSRDGTRAITQMNRDLWITDLSRNVTTRLTSDSYDEAFPVPSPDGSRIAFSSGRVGANDLYVKPASGVGAEQPLFRSAEGKFPTDWSRDGRFLLYSTSDPRGSDIWALPLDGGNQKPIRIVGTESSENLAQLSPDSRWIAYKSGESGFPEIYVQPFPLAENAGRAGGKWTISQGGGHQPRWRSDGKELFYFTGDGTLTAVDVDGAEEEFKAGVPKPLFEARILGGGPTGEVWRWDVAPDGQRFLMITPPADRPAPIMVVLNWQAGLKN